MNDIPALPSIISKLLVMVDQTLGLFASVSETSSFGACGITAYNVTVNDCGNALIDTLGDLIFYGLQMAGHLVKSLEAFSA
jgi:hypothetical protein